MRGRGKKLSLWLLLPAALLALGAPGPTLAQEPPPSGDPAPSGEPAGEAPFDEVAQKHYDDGQAAAKKGDWQAAYTSFRAGVAVQDHYLMVRALGDAAHHLGKWRDAAEFLALSLQKAPPSTPKADREAAEKMLADAKTRVGALAINAPAGAEVFVDKLFVGKAPVGREVYVEPGPCSVEARSGAELGEQTISAEKGTLTNVTVVFGVVSPKPKPTATASVTATSTAPPPPEHPRKEIVIGGLAAGGAIIAAGAVLLGLSAGKASDEEQARIDLRKSSDTNVCTGAAAVPQCAAVKDAAGATDTFRGAGSGLLIGGLAVGAATLTYFLITKYSAPPRVGAAAVVTPHGGAGAISVRW